MTSQLFIFLGAPGAGKGTLASVLAPELDLEHVSTGDMFRAEMGSGSDFGNKVKKIMESGELVSDELTVEIVKRKLVSLGKKGVILDGFPRTMAQAEALDKMLPEIDRKVNKVINLFISKEVIIDRLAGRMVCKNCSETYNIKSKIPSKEGICDKCGGELSVRKDDNEETIIRRFDTYLETTSPLAGYYQDQGVIETVNADQGIEEVKSEVKIAMK